MELMGIGSVAAITLICYLIGMAVKASAIGDKWIPIIVGACGAILGAVGFLAGMPEYPASDILTAIAVGIASGLAATGVNQAAKQMSKGE
jgi:hypothetical protein